MTDLDIAVIGAGISGLALADGLTQTGRSVQVFEARDRLGGRIHTVDVLGGRADLGPTWFWPGEQRVAKLVAELGVGVHDQWATGDALYAANGKTHRIANPAMPHSYRFTQGAASLVEGLAARLPGDTVQLSSPVLSVEPGPNHITLQLENESLTASFVAIATPPALAIHRCLVRTTDLDSSVGQTAAAMPIWMGSVTKAVAVYPEPFWRNDGLSGLVSAPGSAFNEIHDMSGADDTPAMLFGFGQSRGVSLTADIFISQLKDLLGPAAAEPIETQVLDWSTESFTTNTASNRNLDYGLFGSPLLQRPSFEGRLFWTSTETSAIAPGHLEGALAAAERTMRSIT